MSGRSSFRVDSVTQEYQGSGSVSLPFLMVSLSSTYHIPSITSSYSQVKGRRKGKAFPSCVLLIWEENLFLKLLSSIFLCLTEENCKIPYPKPITGKCNGITIIGLSQASGSPLDWKPFSPVPELPEQNWRSLVRKMYLEDTKRIQWDPSFHGTYFQVWRKNIINK